MKFRNLLAGGVVVGLVVGAFVGNWLPNFGSGWGLGPGGAGGGGSGGPGPAPGKEAHAPVANSSDHKVKPVPPPVDVPEVRQKSDDPRVVRVRIDGRDFYLTEMVKGRPIEERASISDIVIQVAATTGDDSGVRIRVMRSPTSKASAEHELQQALNEAQVPPSAVDWQDGPAP